MVDPGLLRHTSAVAERSRRIAEHRQLCRRAAGRFVRAGIERADLEQVATIGLIKAVDRYDDASGTPFEAYAWTFVLGELLHFVRDYEHLVRVPRKLARVEKASSEAADRLRARLRREPSTNELADEIGVDTVTLQAAHAAREARVPTSLDGAALDVVARPRASEHAERIDIELALEQLPPLSRAVVLGLHVVGLRRAELAARLGLSLRRIARINDRALAALARTVGEAA